MTYKQEYLIILVRMAYHSSGIEGTLYPRNSRIISAPYLVNIIRVLENFYEQKTINKLLLMA